MRFATVAELELAVTKAGKISLTEREKNTVFKEIGEVLSINSLSRFSMSINGNLYCGYTDCYLNEKNVYAKFGSFVNLMKIDKKLGLFNNEDALFVAFNLFGYDILEHSSLVQVKF